MAAPAVATTAESATTTAATTHTVTMPSGIASGDLLFIFMGVDAAATTFTLTGWTRIWGASGGDNIAGWWKISDGTEGASVSVTTNNTVRTAVIAYRITGHDAATPPEKGSDASGTSTTPNPGAVTPSGGAKDYLILTGFRQAGEEADDDTWCTAAPTNYTGLLQKTCGTAGAATANVSFATAHRQLTAATTDDPSTFTVAQSLAWVSFTIAVFPTAAAANPIPDVVLPPTPVRW